MPELGSLPIRSKRVGLTSPTGSISLASPGADNVGKLKRWADFTPAATNTPAAALPPTPSGTVARTPLPAQLFDPTPQSCLYDGYQPGFGSLPGGGSSSLPPSGTLSSQMMPGNMVQSMGPTYLQSGGMVMTSGTVQNVTPYGTAMQPQLQPEGMQVMPMANPLASMNGMMYVSMPNGTTQPGMMVSSAQPMVANSTSPPQMQAVTQDMNYMGMMNQPPMMMVGVMPTQQPIDTPVVPPEQADTAAVANAGRQVFHEAMNSGTFESENNNRNNMVVKEAVVLNSNAGPLPSPGSAQHGTGNCQPCAWYWKPKGCNNGVVCQYCHLCPEGELKQRKKAKVTAMRMGALEPSTSEGGPPAIKLTQLLGDL